MRGDLGVGVQGKAVDPGTLRTRQGGVFTLVAKPRTDASDRLARPLPTGNALLHRSGHRAGEFGCVISQGVIAGRHRGVATRFEIPQLAELTDDAMADLLDHRGDVRVRRGLAWHKTWLEALARTIKKHPLEEEQVIVHIQIECTAKALDKRHRPWVDGGPFATALDCLV